MAVEPLSERSIFETKLEGSVDYRQLGNFALLQCEITGETDKLGDAFDLLCATSLPDAMRLAHKMARHPSEAVRATLADSMDLLFMNRHINEIERVPLTPIQKKLGQRLWQHLLSDEAEEVKYRAHEAWDISRHRMDVETLEQTQAHFDQAWYDSC